MITEGNHWIGTNAKYNLSMYIVNQHKKSSAKAGKNLCSSIPNFTSSICINTAEYSVSFTGILSGEALKVTAFFVLQI